MPDAPAFIAKPLLPDLADLNELLDEIWASGIVTNEGPVHNQLELALRQHLGVPNARLFSNGTAALICALRALKLSEGAEIITTPLTFAATAHAISVCGYKPVFADIDETSLTLDPASVARAVTDKTEAVVGVHTYGTICDADGLSAVCAQHGLRLVFDAAHAFGATRGGVPVGNMGDVSIFSMHATKLYNTLEGGLATTRDVVIDEQLKLVRNFGIVDENAVSEIGINGKMSEVHAAIGLLNLKKVEAERAARRRLRASYNAFLQDVPGLRTAPRQEDVAHSEQYYPLVIDPSVFGRSRDDIYDQLKARNIYARKYFWPICTEFTPYRSYKVHTDKTTPVVEWVKNKVLCLPFHSSVTDNHIATIFEVFSGRAA